jgi:hypothetical protein
MLRDGLIDLPDHPELLDELRSVRVVETSQGLLSIDSAPGRHDDQTDALGLVTLTLMERRASTGGVGTSFAGDPISGRHIPGVTTVTYPWERDPWADVRRRA